MEISESTKATMRKIQATLQQIHNGQKIFFNIAQYESKGLTYSRKQWGTDAKGNRVVIRHTHHLTDKAKQFLEVLV